MLIFVSYLFWNIAVWVKGYHTGCISTSLKATCCSCFFPIVRIIKPCNVDERVSQMLHQYIFNRRVSYLIFSVSYLIWNLVMFAKACLRGCNQYILKTAFLTLSFPLVLIVKSCHVGERLYHRSCTSTSLKAGFSILSFRIVVILNSFNVGKRLS